MFMFVIPIFLIASSVRSQHYGFNFPQESAASEAQIRFAIENKYDDTGPGAKGPENAYAIFKALDDALVGYLDDPDTILSEQDKARGFRRLYQNQYSEKELSNMNFRQSNQPASLFAIAPTLSAVKQARVQYIPTLISPKYKVAGFVRKAPRIENEKLKIPSFKPVKESPMNLGYFSRMPSEETNSLAESPRYSYSYGVHDKLTGDSKSAHETREGDKVTGFYTFLDPDGKQRSVHYTADDKLGFRAVVRRTVTNSQ